MLQQSFVLLNICLNKFIKISRGKTKKKLFNIFLNQVWMECTLIYDLERKQKLYFFYQILLSIHP